MNSRQQVRRVACLTLVLVLLSWAQVEAAFASPVGLTVRCHAPMQVHPARVAEKHTMPAGCCPGHPASHSSIALPPTQPRDCCFASDQPVRPRIFLVSSALTIELSAHIVGWPDLPPLSPLGGLWLAESPPFTQSVFAKKTDLRI